MKAHRTSLAIGSLGVFMALAALAQPAPTKMQWTVDGVERRALVFAPSAPSPGGKVPVVFAFHGHGGNARGSAAKMGFQEHWPEAVVVYMQGLDTPSKIDPQGKKPGWQREAGVLGDRDLHFFDTVLAALQEKFPVDSHRIYATGFSNGAFFDYLLWSTRGKNFAAFAPCAGNASTVTLTVPRPLLAIAGERDPLVHLDTVQQTIETVRALNGATAEGVSCGPSCTLYHSTQGAEVSLIVHPGGHVFPPWAGAKIVEFFKAHPLAP